MTELFDLDLARTLLLSIENGKHAFRIVTFDNARDWGLDSDVAMPAAAANRLTVHLKLLERNEFVRFGRVIEGRWLVERITSQGHAFLDAVRGDERWAQMKTAFARVGEGDFVTLLNVIQSEAG